MWWDDGNVAVYGNYQVGLGGRKAGREGGSKGKREGGSEGVRE